MGGPSAHSSRCLLPPLAHPKPGQTCSRFKDAPGLKCSVGRGLRIPKTESSALSLEARLMPEGTLSVASSLMALCWKDATAGNFRK